MPFSAVIEAGHIKPGEHLVDSQKRYKALVKADGSLTVGPVSGSIHKIGALVQGLPACNGWNFWYKERGGKLQSIDEFRAAIRKAMPID